MSEHEAEISKIIEAWEDDNDLTLDDDDFQALGEAIAEQADENGGSYDVDQLAAHHGIVGYEDDAELSWDDGQPDDDLQQRELARLEKQLARKLTNREAGEVATGMVDQIQRLGEVDGQQAYEESYKAKGEQAPDMGNRQDRRKWITERLADERAANAPDTSEREYDLDNKDDRVAYMTARMNGEQFEDAPDEAA